MRKSRKTITKLRHSADNYQGAFLPTAEQLRQTRQENKKLHPSCEMQSLTKKIATKRRRIAFI
jgi:hypothetical protein